MTEKFSVYGFQVEIPEDWRIEFNAKNSRQRGDVAFHSPKNNVFFVSWGKLEDAQRRFRNLEEHRDETIKRFRSDPNMKSVEIVRSAMENLSMHEGLVSRVVARRRPGFMRRLESSHEVWSVHLYCPQTARYYVVYWQVSVGDEFPDFEDRFMSIARTLACHPQPL